MRGRQFRAKTLLFRSDWSAWRVVVLACLIGAGIAGSAGPAFAQRKNPNVVVILADDKY